MIKYKSFRVFRIPLKLINEVNLNNIKDLRNRLNNINLFSQKQKNKNYQFSW